MNCIICSSSSWKCLYPARDRMFGISGRFSEYRCNACGFVRLFPRPSFRELTKYYPSSDYYSYVKEESPSFFGRLRGFLISHLYRPTLLSSLLHLFIQVPAMPEGKAGKILDVGCGSGDTLKLLQAVGWKVYGLDIDKKAVQVAHQRGVRHVSTGGYKAMIKYPDGFFDVIRMYHVIEHLSDPDECIRLIGKKLKSDGEIIIGTPNVTSLISKVAKQYWYNLDCPRHLCLFSPKTLTTLVKNNNFDRLIVSFHSAGGWVGSIQYILEERLAKDIDLINCQWLIILIYPLEWLLDKMRLGDVFVLRARKI